MAYTFLDNSLNTIGVLTNKGGQTNDYWGDSITHEIATSQDVLTSVSLSVDKPSVNIDTSGNQKTWNHVIQGLSFNIDGIGRKVNENDYLIYQEGTNGKYYLMAITQVDESAVQSGFHYKTVQGLNAAAYDLSRKTLRAKSFAQIPDNTQEKGTAQNILRYIFKDINWDVRIIGSFGAIDYEITEGTTAQAVLLDIIGMFEAEVDAYVQLNNWGKGANVFNKNGSVKRIFDFSTSLGKYRGETIRYDKNMVSITKTGARDSMYTKLYVNGNNITIADVNHGADFIVDDVANRKYNKLGAVSTPVTYLEGIITNSAIESPTALLAWGKKQLNILNHPRYNYQISAVNDDEVQLGDTAIIQDTHASDPIYLKSKVISKSVSLADPANNSFIVGEFSPIVIGADNGLEDTNQIMQLVNQANQTAVNAQNKANENAQKIADTRTDLEKTVDQKLQEGKDYSDSLDQKQKEAYDKFEAEINAGMDSAAAERVEISKKADDMLVSANSYADTMYGNAVAVAKDEASKSLSDANKSLEQAKSDLTDGIASEASERQKAVQTVNSQAQSYANQAKSDAIAAAETADGVVRKDFKTTTDSLSSTISQNKQDSDGKISTAQSTATQALDGLKTKVSQTDYNTKTGQLQTDLTATTQTANQAKLDIASIKSEADTQSAQINDIVSDAKGTKQTVSDLKTEQGKQSGSIATLQSRADGFDASITKINDFVNSQGQINQLMNTEFTPDLEGWDSSETSSGVKTPYRQYIYQGSNMLTFDSRNQTDKKYSSIKQTIPFGTSGSNRVVSLSWWSRIAQGTGLYGSTHIRSYDTNMTRLSDVSQVWNSSSSMTLQKFENVAIPDEAQFVEVVFAIREGYLAFLTKPMFVYQSTVGDYVQGNYNNNGALAKVKLTADQAALDLSKYKTDADGRINKAQADITATANAVSTKVSQSDYDKKTQDLDTKYGQVKATADAVTTDVANYKKSNDGKVSANTANITANAKAIALKVSQTDFDATTKDVNTKIANQKITVDNITQSVTELQAKANMQGQVNQLMNTEFNPDLEGWTLYADKGSNAPYASFATYGSQGIGFNTVNADASTFARLSQTILLPSTRLSTDVMSLTWRVNTRRMDNYCHIWLVWQDVNGVSLGKNTMGNWNDSTLNKFNVLKWENISIPIDAKQVDIRFETREGTNAYIFQPMVSFTNTIGDYVPGNYNNNARVSALEVGLDGIIGTVNDPKNGLSATAKLASDGMSIATTAKNDASTAIQTAKGVQTTVDSMGQVNHLNNSEFDPDLEGWDISSLGRAPYRSYFDPTVNHITVGFNTMNDSIAISMLTQTVTLASTPGARGYVSLSWQAFTNSSTTGKQTVSLGFYDSSNKIIGTAKQADWSDTSGKWPVKKIEGLAIPDGATTLKVMFFASEKVTAYLAKPMLAFEKTIGTYTPSNYNNNAKVESVHTQLAGQITDEIHNREKGDDNTFTQASNFTTSAITKSETGMQTKIDQSAAGVVAQVQHVNRLFNTQFTPDLVGWNVTNNGAGGYNNNFYRSYLQQGDTVVGINTTGVNVDGNTTKYYAYFEQDVALPGNNGGTVVSLSWDATTNTMNNYSNLFVQSKRADNSTINSVAVRWDTPVGKGWTHKTWENVSIPKEADHIRISFQTREGSNIYLARPMLTFTPTAYPYMPGGYHSTSTVLELFDDRFALGIKNNTGNIISGINGDTSGLSIVGKQLTLDGNTTVTGDFYAKGGNFKNLNASNITAGTLDVNRLSGNLTDFVKSKWDDAYGNQIDITGSEIKFMTNEHKSWTSISEGIIDMTVYNDDTHTSEHIGGLAHRHNVGKNYQDILTLYLDGYRKIGPGQSPSHGGDAFAVSITDGKNVDDDLAEVLTWENQIIANSRGHMPGWHFYDDVDFESRVINVHTAYQGLRFTAVTMNNTTYPALVNADGGKVGILFGSTELYLMRNGTVSSLNDLIKK